MRMHYVMAHRESFARELVREMGRSWSSCVFVNREDKIRGQRDQVVYRAVARRYAPSIKEQETARKILLMAKAMNMTVLDFYV